MTSGRWTAYDVLYEDEWLLIVHKPSGVLSHPNPVRGEGGKPAGKAAFLGTYEFESRTFSREGESLWLIHRLDQEASGALMAAKSADAARACRELFEKKSIEKYYVALVGGRPVPVKGAWKDCLEVRRSGGRKRVTVVRGRPNAALEYSVRKNFPSARFSLLSIRLITGKTHQIRVQAASHGCPIAGDGLYGDFARNRKWRQNPGIKRLFLHAEALAFRHPGTGKTIRVEAPLPEELASVLEKLR